MNPAVILKDAEHKTARAFEAFKTATINLKPGDFDLAQATRSLMDAILEEHTLTKKAENHLNAPWGDEGEPE